MLTKPLRLLLFLVLVAGLVLSGLAAAATPVAEGPRLDRLPAAIAAQERSTDRLLAMAGVVGTAVGLTEGGAPAVKIFTRTPGVAALPRTLDGVPVVVQVTGEIVAVHHRPGHGGAPGGQRIDPKSRFPRPVPIGVSTGNIGECSSGTIGARLKDAAGNVYALSNNHVYALENLAPKGSQVLQPGRADTLCLVNLDDIIGTLHDFKPIEFTILASNRIDAAIALSSTANLGNSTPSNGYGTPKSLVLAASLGLQVQKYGRTTSMRKGVIDGINATILVRYSTGIARFVDQIAIKKNEKKGFSEPGDSGSLVVTDPGRNPVGLLFAGGADVTFANHIGLVLEGFGVTVDGE